jgi:hypothetical protein
MKDLNPDIMGEWLTEPMPIPANYPHTFTELARWISKGDYENTGELVDRLWSRTGHVPEPVT